MTKELDLDQTEYIDPSLRGFQDNIRQGYFDLIDDPENQKFWEAFRFSYETRRQLAWLPEHDSRDGLAGALTWVEFNFPSQSQDWLIQENSERGMFKPVDDDFREELKSTAGQIVNHPRFINRFASSLPYYGYNRDELDKDTAKSLIKNGLQIYWEQTYARGYSGDPW